MMRFGSLFSGIGGLDLGLERAGMTCAWQIEQDPFCRAVLRKHWPGAPQYSDIREVNPVDLPPVDLVAGGFPCQPHSCAGARKASQDDRDLWPEFARIVGALRPRWVLAENVPGILSSEGGGFFARILGDLARMGYSAEWCRVGAAHVGAPHIRLRIFLVAYADDKRREGGHYEGCNPPGGSHPHPHPDSDMHERRPEPDGAAHCADAGTRGNAGGLRHPLPDASRGYPLPPDAEILPLFAAALHDGRAGEQAEPRMGGGPDGFPSGLGGAFPGGVGHGGSGAARVLTRAPQDSGRWPETWERGIPRVVVAGYPQRRPQLRALGNAVVPQVAEYVGRMIMERTT